MKSLNKECWLKKNFRSVEEQTYIFRSCSLLREHSKSFYLIICSIRNWNIYKVWAKRKSNTCRQTQQITNVHYSWRKQTIPKDKVLWRRTFLANYKVHQYIFIFFPRKIFVSIHSSYSLMIKFHQDLLSSRGWKKKPFQNISGEEKKWKSGMWSPPETCFFFPLSFFIFENSSRNI